MILFFTSNGSNAAHLSYRRKEERLVMSVEWRERPTPADTMELEKDLNEMFGGGLILNKPSERGEEGIDQDMEDFLETGILPKRSLQ